MYSALEVLINLSHFDTGLDKLGDMYKLTGYERVIGVQLRYYVQVLIQAPNLQCIPSFNFQPISLRVAQR